MPLIKSENTASTKKYIDAVIIYMTCTGSTVNLILQIGMLAVQNLGAEICRALNIAVLPQKTSLC